MILCPYAAEHTIRDGKLLLAAHSFCASCPDNWRVPASCTGWNCEQCEDATCPCHSEPSRLRAIAHAAYAEPRPRTAHLARAVRNEYQRRYRETLKRPCLSCGALVGQPSVLCHRCAAAGVKRWGSAGYRERLDAYRSGVEWGEDELIHVREGKL